MGHWVQQLTFSGKTSEKEIDREVNNFAREEGDAGGLYGNLRFKKNYVFENHEKACEWLEENRGVYENIAVQYKKYIVPSKRSAAYTKAEERVKETYSKYTALDNVVHYKGTASKLVTCRTCESKISSKFIRSNNCPVCGKDLRPESALNRIQSLEESWKKARATLKEIDTKEQQKMKYEVCWLAEFEFHC